MKTNTFLCNPLIFVFFLFSAIVRYHSESKCKYVERLELPNGATRHIIELQGYGYMGIDLPDPSTPKETMAIDFALWLMDSDYKDSSAKVFVVSITYIPLMQRCQFSVHHEKPKETTVSSSRSDNSDRHLLITIGYVVGLSIKALEELGVVLHVDKDQTAIRDISPDDWRNMINYCINTSTSETLTYNNDSYKAIKEVGDLLLKEYLKK